MMRELNYKILFAVCLCFAILASMSCGLDPGQQRELTQINVAYFPNITHAQALLLKGQGSLERDFGDEISINWVTFNAGPAEIEALFAGHIDIGFIGPVPAINGFVQSGGALQIIAAASNGGSVLVTRNDSDIYSAADLDGKTVAIPQFGNTQHLGLIGLLTENGLKPVTHGGSVNVVQSSNADIANLVDRGDIDAALVPEHWGSMIELRRNGRVVLDYDEVDSNGVPSTAVIIVRSEFLDAYPEAVARFIEAHKEATEYINNNTEKAIAIINDQIAEITYQAIDEDLLESAFKRLQITYVIPVDSIMNFAKTGVAENFTPAMPDDKLINMMFM